MFRGDAGFDGFVRVLDLAEVLFVVDLEVLVSLTLGSTGLLGEGDREDDWDFVGGILVVRGKEYEGWEGVVVVRLDTVLVEFWAGLSTGIDLRLFTKGASGKVASAPDKLLVSARLSLESHSVHLCDT